MATLSAQLRDLEADVGAFLGFGRGTEFGSQEWDDEQQAAITRCIKAGLRQFYHCGHDWSFLRPVLAVTIGDGERVLRLPEDFGGIDGLVTVSVSGSTSCYQRVPVVGDLRHRYAMSPDATGWPEAVCIDPVKGTTGDAGQQFDLMVYPEPNQAYLLQFTYYVNPEYLTEGRPHPYGGSQHAETISEACLAAAERLLDDQTGIHAAEYQRLLEISKQIDRRNKERVIGYNGDRSDIRLHPLRGRHWDNPPTVTVGGVAYE